MNDNWIDNLRNKLDEPRRQAPEGLWADIEAGLKQRKAQQQARRKMLWWRAAGISAAAAIVALAFLMFRPSAPTLDLGAPDSQTGSGIEMAQSAADQERSAADEHDEPLLASVTPAPTTAAAHAGMPAIAVSEETAAEVITTPAADTTPEPSEKQSDVKANGEDSKKAEQQAAKPEGTKKHYDYYGHSDFPSRRKKSSQSGKISVGLSASNALNSNGTQNGYNSNLHSFLPSDDPINNPGSLLQSAPEEAETKMHHRLPVKAAVSVRYALTDRLSIESGLTYTNLSSTFSSSTFGSATEMEQELHYVGIPVNAIYSVWKNDRFDVYASAGAAVEKCVEGKATVDYLDNGKVVSSNSESVMVDPVQLSVNAAAGVQVNATDKISVFVEPGVGYYFDNGSSVETIYSEKPFNFNVKLGIRINL